MCGRYTVVEADEFGYVVAAIRSGSWHNVMPNWPARSSGEPGTPLQARPTDMTSVIVAAGSRSEGTVSPAASNAANNAIGDAVRLCARTGSPHENAHGSVTNAGSGGDRDERRTPLPPLVILPMAWGFDVDWQRGPVINARIERAGDASSMWRDAFANRRCVVAAWEFFEPHRSETERSPRTGRSIKRQYAFTSPEGAPLLMAGIYDRPIALPADGSVPDGTVLSPTADPARFSLVTTAPNQAMEPIHNRMPLVLSPAEAALWLAGEDPAAFADRSAIALDAEPEGRTANPASESRSASDASDNESPVSQSKPRTGSDDQLSFGF